MENYSRPIVALCVLFVLELVKIAFPIYNTSKAWKTILRVVCFLKLLKIIKIAKSSCLQHILRRKNDSRQIVALWVLPSQRYQNSLWTRILVCSIFQAYKMIETCLLLKMVLFQQDFLFMLQIQKANDLWPTTWYHWVPP